MNREIKFRGIIAENCNEMELDKVFVIGSLINDVENETFEIQDVIGTRFFIDEKTVGQFTGLKDKNGKEIYEGDIIEYTQHKAYNLGGFKAKVVYDKENACFGYTKEKPFIPNFINSFAETDELKYDLLAYIEIIGNIHENSELFS